MAQLYNVTRLVWSGADSKTYTLPADIFSFILQAKGVDVLIVDAAGETTGFTLIDGQPYPINARAFQGSTLLLYAAGAGALEIIVLNGLGD